MRKLLIIIGSILFLSACGAQASPYEVPAEFDVTYSKGNANAKLIITEYSEYDCPYCAKLQLEAFPKLQEEYISKGDVRVIFKDYPISNKDHSQKASEACYCAGEQDEEKFWEMHVKLFENHENLSIEDLEKYAAEIQLNPISFKTCLDSERYKPLVMRNKQEGIANGINSTPTLQINDQLLVGNQPYENIKKAIEIELKK